MLENINDLRIQGGCYVDPTDLNDIFAQRFNVVYGRNGSGKSSIAEAINEWANSDPNVSTSSRFDLGDSLPNELKGHVYVFGKKFIDENFKINTQDNGLNAIVTLGKQVQVDEDIKKQEKIISDNEKDIIDEEKTKSDFEKKRKKDYKVLEDNLLHGKYTAYGKSIVENPNARIPRDYDEIKINGKRTSKTAFELEQEINDNITKIESIKNAQPIYWVAPKMPDENMVERVSTLLTKTLPKPRSLTHDEQRIVDVAVSSSLSHYVGEAHTHFEENGMEYCPLCHQKVDDAWKQKIFEVFASLNDTESQQFRRDLNDCIFQLALLEPDQMPEDAYFKEEVEKCTKAIDEFNGLLTIMVERLKFKEENGLYEPLDSISSETYKSMRKACEEAFTSIAGKISERQIAITNKKNLVAETQILNMQLAYKEYGTSIDNIEKIDKDINNSDDNIRVFNKNIDDAKSELKDLRAQANDTQLALNYINSCLACIFNDPSRMILEDDGNMHYLLKVRGENVDKSNVSEGECNAIALSYFFASMLKNTSERQANEKEKLVVIDDPVTSFDENNKAGILSLIKAMTVMILKGNENSKILVTSHDFRIVRNLESIYRILKKGVLRKSTDAEKDIVFKELKKHKLSDLRLNKDLSYYKLLQQIVNFAATDDEENEDDSIGNSIRRFVEMYKGFRYKGDDMNKVFDSYTQGNAISKYLSNYFSNMNTMVILNVQSHEDGNWAEMYDHEFGTDDMRRLARNLLAFIYLTDKNHLEYTLSDEDFKMVENYAEECKNVALQIIPNWQPRQNIPREILQYKHKECDVEYDGRWYHYKECLLQKKETLEEGMPINIKRIEINNNDKNNATYPYFAYWEEVDDYFPYSMFDIS